jgi:hypothetical protein
MAKRKVELSTNQKKSNASILALIEAERSRLFEDTRALQQQFRRNIKRKRSRNRRLSEELFEER